MLSKNSSSNFIKFSLIKKWNNGSIRPPLNVTTKTFLDSSQPNWFPFINHWSDVPCFAFIKVENFLFKMSQRLLSRQHYTTKSAWFNAVNISRYILFNNIYVTLIILYNQEYKESTTYQQDLLHSCIYHPLFIVPFIVFAYTLAKN